jgi:hypothetical protein
MNYTFKLTNKVLERNQTTLDKSLGFRGLVPV